jgi:hypothetical protein
MQAAKKQRQRRNGRSRTTLTNDNGPMDIMRCRRLRAAVHGGNLHRPYMTTGTCWKNAASRQFPSDRLVLRKGLEADAQVLRGDPVFPSETVSQREISL